MAGVEATGSTPWKVDTSTSRNIKPKDNELANGHSAAFNAMGPLFNFNNALNDVTKPVSQPNTSAV